MNTIGNIDIFQANVLLVVIEEKSLIKASTKLPLTPSAISKIIKKVEKSYNIKIFDKTQKPWQITSAGKVFKNFIVTLIRENENTLKKIHSLPNPVKKFFKLATMPYEDKYLLPKVLTTFYNKYPDFKVDITLDASKKMELYILSKKADFATIILPNINNKIETVPLCDYEIVTCIPNIFLEEMKLSIPKKTTVLPEIDLSKFKNKTFILHKRVFIFRDYEEKILSEIGFSPEPRKIIETSQFDTAINLVTKNQGICFVLDDSVNYLKQNKNLSFFKIKNIRLSQTIALAYLKNRHLSDTEKDFINFMKIVFKS